MSARWREADVGQIPTSAKHQAQAPSRREGARGAAEDLTFQGGSLCGCPEDLLLKIPLFADRYRRREYALVYGASFSNQAGPLELRFWNKSNDFAHFRTKPKLGTR